jgi:LacI family transcriptional regulator
MEHKKTIAILLKELQCGYLQQILLGIIRYVNLRPTWSAELIQFNSNQDIKRYVKESQPDALLAFPEKKETVDQLCRLGLPVIINPSLYRPMDGRLAQILIDDEAVGRMGAEFFLSLGFEHLGFCGFSDVFWSKQRSESFFRRCEEAGRQVHVYEQTVFRKDTSTREGHHYLTNQWQILRGYHRSSERGDNPLSEWLCGVPKPIGIMCCNDYFARRVLLSCRQQELNVPSDVALLGVDNDQLTCEFSSPSLSSVVLNWEKTGFNTAILLDELLNGKTMGGKTIYVRPLHIADRKSTDVLAITHEEVCEAVRFIRDNSSRPITVEEVVERVGSSRRHLELEFKKVRGCAIRNEIQLARVNWVSKMLMETNMSVFQISLRGDFSSHSHMTRMFVRLKGMPPEQYRRQLSIK